MFLVSLIFIVVVAVCFVDEVYKSGHIARWSEQQSSNKIQLESQKQSRFSPSPPEVVWSEHGLIRHVKKNRLECLFEL